MLLKMTAGLSGPDFSLSPGDEREFETAEALRLIEAGFAVAAEETTVRSLQAQERRGRKGKSDVVSTEGDNPTGR